MESIDLSIIILNYNTKQLTIDAVSSIEKNYQKEVTTGAFEVIVVDNASTDGSMDAFHHYKKTSEIKTLHLVASGGNIGFSAGNNKGVTFAKGEYVLFLNPDSLVYPKTLTHMLAFMRDHPEVGAASCKLLNKDGEMDFNCHRGFPTPWNAFCFFSGLHRMFPKSRLFAGYTQGWKDFSTTHEVDAIEGAFTLLPRRVGEKIKWFDEDYFFYGEDLQLCYDIKKRLGLKIYYLGEVKSMHIGGAASGIKQKTQHLTSANREAKIRIQKARFDAMRIFYRKNYRHVYPKWLQYMILKAIAMKEKKTIARLQA
jgi:GT2 family glycosyltransferase